MQLEYFASFASQWIVVQAATVTFWVITLCLMLSFCFVLKIQLRCCSPAVATFGPLQENVSVRWQPMIIESFCNLCKIIYPICIYVEWAFLETLYICDWWQGLEVLYPTGFWSTRSFGGMRYEMCYVFRPSKEESWHQISDKASCWRRQNVIRCLLALFAWVLKQIRKMVSSWFITAGRSKPLIALKYSFLSTGPWTTLRLLRCP